MNILYRLYGFIILVLCTGCSDVVDFGQPEADMLGIDASTEYIMVLGDIQNYTTFDDNRPFLKYSMEWILAMERAGININCVLQVGDITNSNEDWEYNVFRDYTEDVANKIPYIACIGNHDYTWNKDGSISNRNSSLFSKYVTFGNAKAVILERFEHGRMENIVVENYIFGMPYDILVCEFAPRPEVLSWAKSYLAVHPDRRYILLTHEFLWGDGSIVDYGNYAEKQFPNESVVTPTQLWDELVACNDNVACVLCGHNGFSAIRHSVNDFGREVPQILFNLQYQENGGNGMIEIWKIENGSDSISVGVYNTLTREWNTSPETSFKFKYRY